MNEIERIEALEKQIYIIADTLENIVKLLKTITLVTELQNKGEVNHENS